ncbi:MAG: DUF4926 domain-containing protein [Candidatus Binataceae bacterium]
MKLLDVVARNDEMPCAGLRQGQVGTIVELLAPGVFEVEFCALDGASLAVEERRLMVLHHEPGSAHP